MKKVIFIFHFFILGLICLPLQAQILERFESIDKEKISKRYLEIGGGMGADYVILFGSFNVHANIYPIQFRNLKVSINNEVGILLPWARILYYYPSAQIHFPISKTWFFIGAGREYTQVTNETESFNRTIDLRFDAGLKIYLSDRVASSFTIPVRFDDEIPPFFTGFLMKLNFRF